MRRLREQPIKWKISAADKITDNDGKIMTEFFLLTFLLYHSYARISILSEFCISCSGLVMNRSEKFDNLIT